MHNFFSPSLRCRLLGQTALIISISISVPQLLNAQDADAITLAPIVVTSKLDYSGAIEGYLAPATETGVKAGVPLLEVPQSISVVTSTELEVRKPAQVDDALNYVVGVNASTWGTDDRFDQYAIRGFDLGTSALYRDGLPQKALSFSAFSTDPYMLERIDVLRGPAGVLYGSNDAGGMVNLVTKRPTFERLAVGTLSYGSFGTAEVSFDYSNTLNESGTLAGRLTGLFRDGETEVSNSEDDRQFLAGSLTWAPTDLTALTVFLHVQKDKKTPLIFAPVAGEDYNTAWGDLPEDWPYEQSTYNHFKTEQESIGWEFSHEFNSSLSFVQRARYAHQTTDYAQLDYSGATSTGMEYYAFRNDEDAESFGIDNALEWQADFAMGKNSLIGGFDYQRSQSDVTQYLDYSIYTVPYTGASFDFAVTDPALGSVTRSTYSEKGIYFQDHLSLNNGSTITAGLRRSWMDVDIEDQLAGTTSSQSDAATTGMIGFTHEFANGITPYVSYAEGFIQNFGKTISGGTLDPSHNSQWEAGVRHQVGSGLYLSAAVFDLRKTNVKEYDMTDPTWSSFVQVGEVRSRGLELEARGRITDTLQGTFGYAYLDTEITEASDASQIGNSAPFAPENQLSIWLDYDASALVQGLSIGGGVRYRSAAFSTQDNGRETPGYTLADLSLRYDAGEFGVNLSVNNLFDRDYYGVCYDSYGCVKGEGRTIALSVSKSF